MCCSCCCQELYDAAKEGNCGAVEAALQMGDSDFLSWVDEVRAAMQNHQSILSHQADLAAC